MDKDEVLRPEDIAQQASVVRLKSGKLALLVGDLSANAALHLFSEAVMLLEHDHLARNVASRVLKEIASAAEKSRIVLPS